MGTPQPTYLNTAACGLIEPTVKQVADEFYNSIAIQGSVASEQWRDIEQATIKETIASFIGAAPENVAMIPNFSWALNGIIHSLKGTERILLYDKDYPSVLEPFRINKFDIKWVTAADSFTLPVEEITQAISKREVDLVVLSHVQYTSAYKLDIEMIGTLCRQHGVWFIVDATQSLGALPVNVATQNIDVLIASNYKWMNAGFGTGILYMSNEFMQHYTPAVGGANSYKAVGNEMKYIPSVNSYEPGHANMYGLTLLSAAIKHKQQLGIEHIYTHNSHLTSLLLQQLKDLPVKLIGPPGIDNRAAIVLLKDENRLSELIKQHNIIATNRYGLIRISMHYYNTVDDVNTLIDCLKMHR